MNKKKNSTFEREMENPRLKKAFDESYREFLLSEAILTMMEGKKSVRKLAKAARLSPTTIQNVRSKKQDDIRVKSLISISKECGYRVVLQKGSKKIQLQ